MLFRSFNYNLLTSIYYYCCFRYNLITENYYCIHWLHSLNVYLCYTKVWWCFVSWYSFFLSNFMFCQKRNTNSCICICILEYKTRSYKWSNFNWKKLLPYGDVLKKYMFNVIDQLIARKFSLDRNLKYNFNNIRYLYNRIKFIELLKYVILNF